MDYRQLYQRVFELHSYILGVVDEYTLYCFYCKIEDLQLNKAYSSPYREDPKPSFGIYRTKYDIGVEYYWKDLATGESGNIYKLIQKIEQLRTKEEVYQKINEDFGLGLELGSVEPTKKIKLYGPPQESIIKLTIAPVPLTVAGVKFWKQFEIDPDLLCMYHVSQIQWYWSTKGQEAPKAVLNPTFAYRLGKYYQIYSPYAEKSERFRNDLPDNYFFGYMQLSNSGEKLIIDKSCKDVIFCRRLGYEAVAPRAEGLMIPHLKMLELKDRFKEIYITLDPDPTGKRMTEEYLSLYPWLKPRFLTQSKDKTDLCKLTGFEQARDIINKLLK